MKKFMTTTEISKSFAFLFIVLGHLATLVAAQSNEIPRRTVEMTWDSGFHDGPRFERSARSEKPAISEIISESGVPWMQLVFGESRLSGETRIEITSLLDGATQVLDSKSFAEWNHRSAYFNGDAVEVRLFVGVSDVGARVQVKGLIVGEWGASSPKSICGPLDNRTSSTESRVGRIDPLGCTGWVVSNGNLVTAGHCLAGSGNTILSFDPPPSLSDGTVQFPGPEKQYAIDQNSFKFADNGAGDDWGVFSVADNSQTGLQPISAQGSFNIRREPLLDVFRVTGFGGDNGTSNKTNQTHIGFDAGSSGTTLHYRVDTESGNSGSPVIDVVTGEAVGIHTHGGCGLLGGSNRGTSFLHQDAWNEISATWSPWWTLGTPSGITFASGPAVSSWGVGRLDVFARGSDNAIWFKSYTGSSWSPWWTLGGGLTSDPAAVSWGPGRIDMFARGLDNAIWFRSYTGSSWSPWWSLGTPPGITFASGPAVSSWGAGRLDVFARGSDDAIWFRSYTGSSWSPWWTLGGGLTSDPAAVSWGPGRIDMFARGFDNAIWFRSYTGSSWSSWWTLGTPPGVTFASGPAVSSWAPGRLDVFARGSDGAIWVRCYLGGIWSSWTSLGGGLTSNPAAVSWGSGRIDMFARGLDNAIWFKSFF